MCSSVEVVAVYNMAAFIDVFEQMTQVQACLMQCANRLFEHICYDL